MTLSGSQEVINIQVNNAVTWNSEFLSPDCSTVPLVAYLFDHKATTLDAIVDVAKRFSVENSTD